MNNDIATGYISLGRNLRDLMQTEDYHIERVNETIEKVLKLLVKLDFKHSSSHVYKLEQIRNKNEAHACSMEPDSAILKSFADVIASAVHPIWDTLYSEADQRHLVRLFRNEASDKLRELVGTLQDDAHEVLLSDTIRCLECGANRAAIVMGWNLTYEHVRRWVFVDGRRDDFNKALTAKYKSKNKQYDPISSYEDFFKLNESMVIDVCFEAQLFLKEKAQVLTGALNRRNHFAHPSFAKATSAVAAGYIEDLIINIIDDPHFK